MRPQEATQRVRPTTTDIRKLISELREIWRRRLSDRRKFLRLLRAGKIPRGSTIPASEHAAMRSAFLARGGRIQRLPPGIADGAIFPRSATNWDAIISAIQERVAEIEAAASAGIIEAVEAEDQVAAVVADGVRAASTKPETLNADAIVYICVHEARRRNGRSPWRDY